MHITCLVVYLEPQNNISDIHYGLLHQPLEHHLPILQQVVLVVGKQLVHNDNHKVGPLGQEVVQQHQHVEGGVADWLLT